jgi:hypothetical protein
MNVNRPIIVTLGNMKVDTKDDKAQLMARNRHGHTEIFVRSGSMGIFRKPIDHLLGIKKADAHIANAYKKLGANLTNQSFSNIKDSLFKNVKTNTVASESNVNIIFSTKEGISDAITQQQSNIKNELKEKLFTAIPWDKLEINITSKTTPNELNQLQPHIDKLNTIKNEMKLNIDLIVDIANENKSERKSKSSESLSGLKDSLLKLFREAATETISEAKFQTELDTLNKILYEINDNEKKQNSNSKAPNYIPTPPTLDQLNRPE